MKPGDRDLGMDRPITRRDFLQGSSALAAGMALGWPHIAAAAGRGEPPYPPARTGLRGAHPGSFEVAHAVGLERIRDFGPVVEDGDAVYDLVIVGAGISGLAAAYYWREREPGARILILDNHDDFGGHAKRNEFRVGDRLLLGHGGSQSFEMPSAYSDVAKNLLRDLGVDLTRFESAYDHEFYRRRGLESKLYFDAETWGVDRLVPNPFFDPSYFIPIDARPDRLEASLAEMPLSPAARDQLRGLIRIRQDRVDEPIWKEPDYLRRISYFDFLRRHAGVTEPQLYDLLRDFLTFYFGVGLDATSAFDALLAGLPGLGATGLGRFEGWIRRGLRWLADPYIYHFPDGNASLARLLVRRLIPGIAPGDGMEDVVTAAFDYARLDEPDSMVRIRLDSTVVRVEPEGVDGAPVGIQYVRGGVARRVRGRACILACWHSIIPRLLPELPAEQTEALVLAVKVPLVYTNVLLSNWRAFEKAGLGQASCPGSWHSIGFLDFPVSLESYCYSAEPDEPIVWQFEKALAWPGLRPRDQRRVGRAALYGTSFEEIERAARRQLAGMLDAAGFDPAREILGITVNRWPHGYSHTPNPLFDPDHEPGRAPHEIARKRFGRIAIANSDAAARAYVDAAIDEAWRAVGELTASPSGA
jgi:spermidine dehydrogenase